MRVCVQVLLERPLDVSSRVSAKRAVTIQGIFNSSSSYRLTVRPSKQPALRINFVLSECLLILLKVLQRKLENLVMVLQCVTEQRILGRLKIICGVQSILVSSDAPVRSRRRSSRKKRAAFAWLCL